MFYIQRISINIICRQIPPETSLCYKLVQRQIFMENQTQ